MQPTYITVTNEWLHKSANRSERQIENESHLSDNTHIGRLSMKAANRLKNSINWLIQSADDKLDYNPKTRKPFTWQVNFVTLTLPSVQGYWTNTLSGQTYWIPDKCLVPPHHNPLTRKFTPFNVTDNELKKVHLHRFLNAAKYKFNLRNYVWKIETQATGSLHFHITTDTFMNCHQLRIMWNKILGDTPLMSAFEQQYGHRNPNSTDVHSVYDIENLGAYLASYMSKKEKGKRACIGRLWSCSNQLNSTNKCSHTVFDHSEDNSLQVLINSDIPSGIIEGEKNALGFVSTIAEIYYLSPDDWEKLNGTPLKAIYNEHRYHIRHNLERPPPEYWEDLLYPLRPPELRRIDELLHSDTTATETGNRGTNRHRYGTQIALDFKELATISTCAP